MKEEEKSFRCFWIPGSSYVTPYNCLYGEAPPETGTFFGHQVYERVAKSTSSPGRSSLAREKRPGDEVVGKSVIFLCKKAQKRAHRCILWLWKSSWVCSYLKDGAITVAKREATPLNQVWEGVPTQIAICQQKGYKRGTLSNKDVFGPRGGASP